ncbi:MAG: OadG family protein [Desulfarculaceae bacterium]|jgi:Na+-transporting methylmalonyl-CoA/oxaloacetate decarboxylase gamma subunit
MQPTDWGEAFRIVVGGIVAVFFIMSLLALTTHFMGKIFIGLEKRKKEKAKSDQGEEAEA